MPAVVRSLVESIVQKVDASSDDVGLGMRGVKLSLVVLRSATTTRLGSPIFSTSERLLAFTDRAIDAGMETRAYTSAERIAMQSVITNTARFQTASNAVEETRAKARARYQRLRSSLARLPSELKTNLHVYYMAKNERMMTMNRDSRAALKIQFGQYKMLLNEKISSSKTLNYLTMKLKNLLIFAHVLSTDPTEVPRLIPIVRPSAIKSSGSAKDMTSIVDKVSAAPPRTFTSFSTVTPTTMMTAMAGDIACISPAMLDSLRRGLESNNAAASTSTAAQATDTSNPADVQAINTSNPADEHEEETVSQAFNAEGRGGLWVPSPAKVRTSRSQLTTVIPSRYAVHSESAEYGESGVPPKKEVSVLKAAIENNIKKDAQRASGKGARKKKSKKQPFASSQPTADAKTTAV